MNTCIVKLQTKQALPELELSELILTMYFVFRSSLELHFRPLPHPFPVYHNEW